MAKRSRPAVITAAAQRIIDPQSPNNRSHAPDARALYSLYDQLGPIHNAMQTKFYAASKITYFAARRSEPGADPEMVEDGPAVEAFERIKGPGGDFADFVAEMAMHWEIPGEGYLIGQGGIDGEEWDVISPVEYEDARRDTAREDDDKRLGPDDFVMRSWRAHPMKRKLPDSPLRSIVAECEQFILYRDVLTALGKSRLLAPILFVPSEIEFPDTDDDGTKRSFGDFLIEAMVATVQDTRSAGRIAPITIEASGDRIAQAQVIDLTRDLPDWIPDMLEKVGRHIATGLDMPSEILTGMGDLNHWTAWLTDDSLRLNYVDPLILAVLDSFTRGYLIPTLQEQGVADAESYLFWRDYSDLTSRTVGAEVAINMFQNGTISAEALRRTVGFTEADAPEEMPAPGATVDGLPVGADNTQRGIPGENIGVGRFGVETAEDIAKRVTSAGILIRSGFDPEAALAAVGLPPIAHLGLLPVTVKDSQQIPSDGVDPTEIVASALAEFWPLVAAASPPSLAAIDHRLYTQISEAAQAALDRAMERAGAKVRREVVGDSRKPPKHPTFAAAVHEVDDLRVCLTLGRDVVRQFAADDDLMPEGVFDRLGQRVRKLLKSGLDETYATVSQITDAQPRRDLDVEEGWVVAAVAALVEGLRRFALGRLFTPTLEPDPAMTGEVPQTDVPAALVFEVMTIGGGGSPGVGPDVPRGLATGQVTEDWVNSVGYQIRERIWTVGAPAMPFEPHRALSGTRFTEWTSARLKTPLTASWLGYDFMFPGDHRGCQCVAELVIREAEGLLTPLAASA